MQKVKEQLAQVLESFERELGSRSTGLAYMQSEKEWLFKFLDKEEEYVKFLEQRIEFLYKDNEELRTKIQIPMPYLDFKMKSEYDFATQIKSFFWRLETIAYRTPILEHEKWDTDFWKRVRWQSYRGFLKLFRKEYDENFKRYMETSNQ